MSNAYQPEVDFLHSWAVVLPKFSSLRYWQDCCARSKSEAARENPPATFLMGFECRPLLSLG